MTALVCVVWYSGTSPYDHLVITAGTLWPNGGRINGVPLYRYANSLCYSFFFALSTPINQRAASQFEKGKGYARGASEAKREGALARNRRLLLFLKLPKQITNAFTFWIFLMSFLFSTFKNDNFGQLRKAFLECFECAHPREGDAPLRLIV